MFITVPVYYYCTAVCISLLICYIPELRGMFTISRWRKANYYYISWHSCTKYILVRSIFFLYIWYIPADILICTCEKRYDTYYDVSLYEYIYSLSEYIRINSTYDNADWHPTDIGMKYVCNAHTSIHGWMANGILRSRSFSWYKSRVAYITDEGNLLVLIIISFDN